MAVLGTTSLTGCTSIPDFINTGSIMIFHQSTTPTSWTKLTDQNDATLRVVSGTVSTGGTLAFSTTLNTRPISGSVSSTTLTTTQMPSHPHSINAGGGDGTRNYRRVPAPSGAPFAGNIRFSPANVTATSRGGSSHTHPLSVSTNTDFRVLYIDIIFGSKN
jgi:hypothetical protein